MPVNKERYNMSYLNRYIITTHDANKNVKPGGPAKDVMTPTKFDDAKIQRLFNMLNNDSVIYQCVWWSRLQPVTMNSFKNQDYIKNFVKGKFNTYCEIFAGTVYDNAWTDKKSPTMDDRLEGVKKTVNTLLDRITVLLDQSAEFSDLKVELMNKKLEVIVIKADRGDDGNDTFGSQVFLKICYKNKQH